MTVYEPAVLSFYNREGNASIIETQCGSAWHYTAVRITRPAIARDYANNKLAVGCTMHETFRRFNVPASNASPLYRYRNKDNREILAARTSTLIHSSHSSLNLIFISSRICICINMLSKKTRHTFQISKRIFIHS